MQRQSIPNCSLVSYRHKSSNILEKLRSLFDQEKNLSLNYMIYGAIFFQIRCDATYDDLLNLLFTDDKG